jgi:hypothetical protein
VSQNSFWKNRFGVLLQYVISTILSYVVIGGGAYFLLPPSTPFLASMTTILLSPWVGPIVLAYWRAHRRSLGPRKS